MHGAFAKEVLLSQDQGHIHSYNKKEKKREKKRIFPCDSETLLNPWSFKVENKSPDKH